MGGDVVDDQVHALLVFQAVEVHGPGHRLRCDLPIFRRTRRARLSLVNENVTPYCDVKMSGPF